MTIRTEWSMVCQYGPDFSSGDAITLVGRRRQMWPCVSEFRTVNVPTRWQENKVVLGANIAHISNVNHFGVNS